MKMHKFFLLAAACAASFGAVAQWQWVDKDGRKVFSDRPPPADIPDKAVLKQPSFNPRPAQAPASAAEAASAAGAQAAPNAAASASKPALSGKDKELQEKKAQAEAAEEAKKKAEEEKMAAARAENCARARKAKAAFDSGRPMTQTNAQGERIFLDEAARASEVRRIDAAIASDCGPMPKK